MLILKRLKCGDKNDFTSKNDGHKLSKKTPLDNPLMPRTIETLWAVKKIRI